MKLERGAESPTRHIIAAINVRNRTGLAPLANRPIRPIRPHSNTNEQIGVIKRNLGSNLCFAHFELIWRAKDFEYVVQGHSALGYIGICVLNNTVVNIDAD